MIVLGINAYHGDSSACLVRDGQLVAAAEEERFRRIKHWAGFPSQAIAYCLSEARIALSCEALRTTTRMMHAVAWLLNHRAYFRGEISEFQLRRYGKLQSDFPAADPERLALLSPSVCELIGATERFYARLSRLDKGWRDNVPMQVPAIRRLRDRLSGMVG